MLRPTSRLVSSLLVCALVGFGPALACSGNDAKPRTTVTPAPFGGSGPIVMQPEVVVGEGGQPLAQAGRGGQGGGTDAPPPVCNDVPPSTRALLDDFEDGDHAFASEAGREGYWYTIDDKSAGGIVKPKDELVPEPGGVGASRLAAHVVASGFTEWGAALSSTLTHKGEVRCPYDASGFAGVRFLARGSGRVRFVVIAPATVDKQYGGTCDPAAGQVCFDSHGTFITLTDDWRLYEVPWAALTQRDFGTPAELLPSSIMGVQFSFEVGDLPTDFWLDDIALWDGVSTPPSSDGDGGAGGEGGGGGADAAAGGAGDGSSAGGAGGAAP